MTIYASNYGMITTGGCELLSQCIAYMLSMVMENLSDDVQILSNSQYAK